MITIRNYSFASLLSSLLLGWVGISTPSQAKEATTNLFDAVEQSNSAAITKLIESGADPNELNERGNTALHEAILRNEAKVVQTLMASGADATIRNGQGYSSAFLCSVVKKNTAITALLMGVADDSADVVPYPLASFGSLPQGPRKFTSPASLIQWNPRFGYRFFASPFWKLQGIQQDGAFKNQSIVVVSLPPLWSAIENQSIENAISVYAIERETIKSLDLAVKEFLTRNPSAKSSDPKVVADADPKRTKFTYEQVDSGLTYQKQSVIIFNNGIYYQIDFTATPGTFDKNLPVFKAFCEGIEFTKKALLDDVKPKGEQTTEAD